MQSLASLSIVPLSLWCLAFGFGLQVLINEFKFLGQKIEELEGKQVRRDFLQGAELLLFIQERLQSGNVLEPQFWLGFYKLREPFQSAIPNQLQAMRKSGVALLPSIERLLQWSQEQLEVFDLSQSAVATARGQAFLGGVLIPIFSILFYQLVPELQEHLLLWSCVSAFAFFLAVTAGVWILSIAARARWGGLEYSLRPLLWVAPLTLEYFHVQIRAGTGVEQAWVVAKSFALSQVPELSKYWGVDGKYNPKYNPKNRNDGLRGTLLGLATQMQRVIFLSVMEGVPVSERIQHSRVQVHALTVAAVKSEVNSLGIHVLKPLFILLFPALLGLIGTGIGLALYEGFQNGI